ncbi:auxin response factor 17 [Neltuma alba]|uniref:auxin response factor 17 n=1 Tax=Neltuma alba TaxID=207710 RepID=UPI0010A2F0BD|nr:auxin response factor 17-like [Prosopis alba]XP_028757434.1 auxin response factor 17-like [Prosopis alba]XP_028757435.1 auxin response factor 17-like [Prosopis alba]
MPLPPSRPPPSHPCRLPQKIWRACAGTSVQIPTLNSRVYYFPQGHLEQACSAPSSLSPFLLSKPFIHCRVSWVEFLADPVTDEVFAKLVLHPLSDFDTTRDHSHPTGESAEAQGDDNVGSFAKVLTPSDANNGGGFSVPRFCADSIFPPLNLQSDRPNQTLPFTDVHGILWEFRHIYRGTPKRHLLTTGWNKFVNHKKLIAGDSVVFMKNSAGKMFIGVRRALRFSVGNRGNWAGSCTDIGGMKTKVELDEEQQEDCYTGFGEFSRNGRGKLSAKAAAEAAESAAQNKPFVVVHYPRPGSSDFVLKAEVVEEALRVRWTPGMRVKMAMETEDSSRMTWFHGTVYSVSASLGHGHWSDSPWRMLQIAWDEPEVLQNAKRVSPWQVEHISPAALLHTVFPPAKKFKGAKHGGLPIDREEDPSFTTMKLTNSTMGHLNHSLLKDNTFPAGMQGARHDLSSVLRFSNFLDHNTRYCAASSHVKVPKLKTVSTDLHIDSSQSGPLSPDSQRRIHSIGGEFVGTACCNSTIGAGSFQLFGKIIQMNPPVESGLHGTDCTGNKACNASECTDKPLDYSTCSKLVNKLDIRCQKTSLV